MVLLGGCQALCLAVLAAADVLNNDKPFEQAQISRLSDSCHAVHLQEAQDIFGDVNELLEMYESRKAAGAAARCVHLDLLLLHPGVHLHFAPCSSPHHDRFFYGRCALPSC